jgi:surfeit locus 1 family protein
MAVNRLWPQSQQAWIILLAALVAMALTARLGWWQLDRARQKTERQEALSRQRALPPLGAAQLPLQAPQIAAAEHRAVQLKGQWQDAHTIFLDNRTMVGRAGFFVLTPLALEGGAVVLVQRGFWPRHVSDPQRVDAPAAPQGLVTVQGRIALAPSRMFELGDTAQTAGATMGRIRQNLDPVAYASETRLPLLPFVVVQENRPFNSDVSSSAPTAAAVSASASTATAAAAAQGVGPAAAASLAASAGASDGLMRQWPQADLGKQKNVGYALQWFAMSLLVLGLYLWFQIFKPLRHSGAATRGPQNPI